MNDRFEDELRGALRPVDPGADFAARVLAQTSRRAPETQSDGGKVVRLRRRVLRWLPLALAATLVAAVLVRHEYQLRRELEQGRIAREQLMEALRVTSDKLDMAYRAAQGQPAIELQDEPEADDSKPKDTTI